MNRWSTILATLALTGCALPPGTFESPGDNVRMVDGPPIQDVVTSFDDALSCLRGKIQPGILFAVGQVVDATGKETYADGGTGKFVTQGAGEMVQTALFRAGVSVVNRRDPNISITEANWGIRDIKRQAPVNFYVSGSINSLDFIPGGGFSATVAGIGPRKRQSRILVALDLTMTDAYTGRVVANIPLQKQIYTSEIGASAGTFFGDTLVQMDAGGMEREAMHFALRQMLNLATFELLGQLMNQDVYAGCRTKVALDAGAITAQGTADRAALSDAIRSMRNNVPPPLPKDLEVPLSMADTAQANLVPTVAPQSAPAAQGNPEPQLRAPEGQPAGLPAEALARGRKATQAATQAIRVARESLDAPDRKIAVEKAAEALQLSNFALMLLREAAEQGFNGDEGEVAAVVIQQALKAAQEAGTAATMRQSDVKTQAQATGAGKSTVPAADDSVPAVPPPPPSAPLVPLPGGPIQDRRAIGGQ